MVNGLLYSMHYMVHSHSVWACKYTSICAGSVLVAGPVTLWCDGGWLAQWPYASGGIRDQLLSSLNLCPFFALSLDL